MTGSSSTPETAAADALTVLGLEPVAPADTYLSDNGYETAWIGSKWDIGVFRDGRAQVWRKGNFVVTVGSIWTAIVIVADDIAPDRFTVVSGGEGLRHGVALEEVPPMRSGTFERRWRVVPAAAPGTTAEPEVVGYITQAGMIYGRDAVDEGIVRGRFDGALTPVTAPAGWRAAGATAPETTAACEACDGHGAVQTGSYDSAECPSCGGSGVAETTP